MTTFTWTDRSIPCAACASESLIHRRANMATRLRHFFQGWRKCYARYRERRALLALDTAMLKDIGISRVDAIREGRKPFWRS
jgi:uncharacterized protein YjiS (DUF1127 family)